MNAIFLDRDGVLNENRDDHVKNLTECQWIPSALLGLRELARLRIPIIVITNQSIIGRGLATAATVEAIHQHMAATAQLYGGRIDAFRFCPHHPQESCRCRKPQPGLLQQAAREFNIDLHSSLFIGDAFTDYQAASATNTRYIHVLTGRGPAAVGLLQQTDPTIPIVADLLAAVPLCQELLRQPTALPLSATPPLTITPAPLLSTT